MSIKQPALAEKNWAIENHPRSTYNFLVRETIYFDLNKPTQFTSLSLFCWCADTK